MLPTVGTPQLLGGEDGVEGGGELCVAIADEELGELCLVGELHRDVAGILSHPCGAWDHGDAGDADEARVVVDDHEDVEPAEKNGVDVEDVTRRQSLRLGGEELRPGLRRPARRRLDGWRLRIA